MKQYPYQGSKTDKENQIYADFESKANAFAENALSNYIPQHYKSNKVIHDCVWGSVMFYPWELQIMDSPLIQRLRKIKQLGLALYTYPSAQHSRFEHTLGVCAVASQMINSINSGMWSNSEATFSISKEHVYMIRLAALLHDVGHCFFSHLSERIYSEMEQFTELKSSFAIFKRAQAHEILAYIIINTPAFFTFFRNQTDYPYKGKTEADTKLLLQNIGRMIVGAYIEPYVSESGNTVLPYFLTEMINGQFDADALDYLKRDSYATGLELTYNLDRFLYKIRIVEYPEHIDGRLVFGQHLTVPASGISTVEEMMYNKQMLTRYIYQHQKVMSVDSVVSDIAHGLVNSGRLSHPCDFLYLTDDSIYMLQNSDNDFSTPLSCIAIAKGTDKTIGELVSEITARRLPKKALVMNAQTILSIRSQSKCSVRDISDFLQKNGNTLRSEIYKEAKKINSSIGEQYAFDMYDIYVAVPKFSMAKDYSSVYVVSEDNKFVPISEVVNLNSLANTYANYSWNSYVFAEPDILPLISVASKNVLEEYGVVFYENVFSYLKHADDIQKLIMLQQGS